MEKLGPTLEYMRTQRLYGSVNTALVVSRALERGIEVRPGGKRRILLRSGGKSIFFRGGWISLNTRFATRCARDKLITSRILRSRGVHAPQGAYFEPHEVRRAWAWAKSVAPVVVKPVVAKKGRGVHLGISDRRSFVRAFEDVASAHGGVLVETFASGSDHRVYVVQGRVIAATRREPANVVGDGVSTIEALISHKNRERAERGFPDRWRIRVDEQTIGPLRRHRYDLRSVPHDGDLVRLRATANVSTGGDAIDATDDLAADEVTAIEQAATAFPGLYVAGFDVILSLQHGERVATIIEVNAAPGLGVHHLPWAGAPRDAASALLESVFPHTVR